MKRYVEEVTRAYAARAWKGQGYSSWDAYVEGVWAARRPKVHADERARAARTMRGAGMPFRDIGIALGIGHQTAHRDVNGRVRPNQQPSTVYVIGSPEFRPVKIGKGYSRERLDMCQTGSPFLLEILWETPGGLELEGKLHKRFAEYRIRGEWFDFPKGRSPVEIVAEAALELAVTTLDN